MQNDSVLTAQTHTRQVLELHLNLCRQVASISHTALLQQLQSFPPQIEISIQLDCQMAHLNTVLSSRSVIVRPKSPNHSVRRRRGQCQRDELTYFSAPALLWRRSSIAHSSASDAAPNQPTAKDPRHPMVPYDVLHPSATSAYRISGSLGRGHFVQW